MTGKHETCKMLVGPLVNLLRSRKFMVALMTVVVDVVVTLVPSLAHARAELLTVLTVVGTALVAAIAVEDGLAQGGGQ